MRHRPRWGLLFLGALLVGSLFAFPLWRKAFTGRSSGPIFPLAEGGQREILLKMPDRNLAATAYLTMLTVVPVPTEGQSAAVPPDAEIILSGDFTQIDALHRATGKVYFYRLRDGGVTLSLENFSVTNAPSLTIYLSSAEDPKTLDQLGGIAPIFPVGSLKGTTGDQQYTIPKELHLERYHTLVIVSDGLQSIYSVAPIK